MKWICEHIRWRGTVAVIGCGLIWVGLAMQFGGPMMIWIAGVLMIIGAVLSALPDEDY